jgi:hypothetical protein
MEETDMKKWIDLAAHLVPGTVFTVFGLNGLIAALTGSGFIPMPELPVRAAAFMGAMAATGYFLPVLKIVEIVGGVMLVTRRFVPLALVLLAPVVVQIVLFHLFLEPSGLPLGIVLMAAEAYLGVVVYKNAFRPVLSATPPPR